MKDSILLQIQNLDVTFPQKDSSAHALRGIDLTILRGKVHGLVGESGSGKSVTSKCIMGLLDSPPASINSGKVLFNEKDILSLDQKGLRALRGKEISMVFQEPSRYLNPAFKIGDQIAEMLIAHFSLSKKEARDKALEYLVMVGLGGDRRVLNSYPHELSGGMRQRAMIALAIACNPDLLIADEPTTALDVTLQLQILKLLVSLKEKLNMTVLFISHDLGVIHDIADIVSVIYAGKIVEVGSKESIFANALHPYTRLLLKSKPDPEKRGKKLVAIPGRVPDSENIPSGCAFHPRCPLADDKCREEIPPMKNYEGDRTAACHYIGIKEPV